MSICPHPTLTETGFRLVRRVSVPSFAISFGSPQMLQLAGPSTQSPTRRRIFNPDIFTESDFPWPLPFIRPLSYGRKHGAVEAVPVLEYILMSLLREAVMVSAQVGFLMYAAAVSTDSFAMLESWAMPQAIPAASRK